MEYHFYMVYDDSKYNARIYNCRRKFILVSSLLLMKVTFLFKSIVMMFIDVDINFLLHYRVQPTSDSQLLLELTSTLKFSSRSPSNYFQQIIHQFCTVKSCL